MARFVSQINVGENVYRTYLTGATTTDDDVGKPVKLASADTVELCADGDEIYGFISSVADGTTDGYKKVGVLVEGRCKVILSGDAAVGTLVEAAANTAIATAKAGAYGIVSVHTIDTTSAATLAADLFMKKWMVISGAGTDTTTVLIEKQ